MIVRLAVRSLAIRPVRTAVLACGFGLGIAVMAQLLGVGEVILDQARSPALQGGGDLVVSGAFGAVDNARFVLSSVLGAADLQTRIAAASPSKRARLYVITPGTVLPIGARGGIPSLEKAVGDPEVVGEPRWIDGPDDARWARPDPGDLLRAMDRFHPRPEAPAFTSSWAEWLYFNGRTADGGVRFYLTFIVGPSRRSGFSAAGVRLQLERAGRIANYSFSADLDARTLVDKAPDLDVGENRVRLEGLRYRIRLRLPEEGRVRSEATGELTLDAVPGRSLPPAVIHGAHGWLSGYVVPVLSGTVRGTLQLGTEALSLDGAAGYHDHNWGFWQDVRWQWGQVAHDDLSFVYGRVFPPASVADPSRMPGFLGVLGPDGPIGVSTDVTIAERGPGAAPEEIVATARGAALDLTLRFSVDRSIRTALGMTQTGASPSVDFLQLAGTYHVAGRAGTRSIDFTARGAAETFRPR
jgi:hypothetical protein